MSVTLEQKQAILLRLFTDIFGKENIIFDISLWLLLEDFVELGYKNDLEYKNYKCLFTVLGRDDMPKMVVDFDPLFERDEFIDLKNIEKNKMLEKTLKGFDISYVLIDEDEFKELTHPTHKLSLVDLLNYKLGLDEE